MTALTDMKHATISGFWAFVQERENIRIAKGAGKPPPWTEDKSLSIFFFCNVRREDDRGTQYYLNNIVPKADDKEDLFWRTCLYRAVNNIAWFEESFPSGVFGIAEWREDKQRIVDYLNDARLPYSSAYIVLQGPDGRERKAHFLDLTQWMDKNIGELVHQVEGAKTLREVWKKLQLVPYVGEFISLQVYRDLILAKAIPFVDDDFTYLGGGARQGLNQFGFKDYRSQYLALQELQKRSPDGLELNLGDMEQAMCEYRKWMNLNKGGGRHRYYKGNVAANRGSNSG